MAFAPRYGLEACAAFPFAVIVLPLISHEADAGTMLTALPPQAFRLCVFFPNTFSYIIPFSQYITGNIESGVIEKAGISACFA